MSKKYTAKETREILLDVLCGALEHMEAIKSELIKLNLKQDGTDDPNNAARAKVLTLTLTCLNDVIHPAHKILYKYFKGAEDLFDMYVENHKIAVDNKLVPPCKCNSCKDSNANKVQELS